MHKCRSLNLVVVFLAFFCLSAIQSNAQSRKRYLKHRFKAGLSLGINMAQLDGDQHGGYNKLGLSGGLRGIAILSESTELVVELLYSQQGSKSDGYPNINRQNTFQKPVKVSVNVAEVPIMLNHKIYNTALERHIWEFHWGVSFGRLLNQKVEELTLSNSIVESYEDLVPGFNSNSVSGLFGLRLNFTDKFGLSARHSYAFTKLYQDSEAEENQISRLRSYYFSLLLQYTF